MGVVSKIVGVVQSVFGINPAFAGTTLTNGFGIATPGGRLTLTTGTPVTNGDVTAAGTVFYTPYIHDQISLWDGTQFQAITFTEKSIALSGMTASKPADIWGVLSGGTLALDFTSWSTTTSRVTALARHKGRLVKSGDNTRLYLGTVNVDASNQAADALTLRGLANWYNPIKRRLYVASSYNDNNAATTGTIAAGSWGSLNTQHIFSFLQIHDFPISLFGKITATAGAGGTVGAGIGVLSTTRPLAGTTTTATTLQPLPVRFNLWSSTQGLITAELLVLALVSTATITYDTGRNGSSTDVPSTYLEGEVMA